jgi:hypothetical protein
MTIEYGEIFIIHDMNEYLNNIYNWLGVNIDISEETKIIVKFENTEIYEIDNNIKKFNFTIQQSSINFTPLYLKKIINYKDYQAEKIIFNECNDNLYLRLNIIFENYKQNIVNSKYNCAFYIIGVDNHTVFGLVSIKSSEIIQRLLFSYDTEIFNKEEILYVINGILKGKFN